MTELQTNIANLKELLSTITSSMMLRDNADESGASCSYYRGNDSVGLKVYRYAGEFAKSIKLHKQILEQYGFAPLMFGTFSVYNAELDTTFHVLLVEHVQIFGNTSYQDEDEEEFFRVLFSNFTQRVRNIAWDCEDEFFQLLADDLHRRNVGFRGETPLMIDFSI